MRAADQPKRFFRMALMAAGLAFVAVVTFAHTRLSEVHMRLSEVGLDCPSWSGCYGVLFAPVTAQDLPSEFDPDLRNELEKKRDIQQFSQLFIRVVLSFLLIRLAWLGWQLKRRRRAQQIWIPLMTLGVTFFFGIVAGPMMAMFGSATFEHRFKPLVQMMQFVGGMVTLGLLWWIVLRENRVFRAVTPTPFSRSLRLRTLFALALVAMQIVLGGWSMVNVAALACPDFPMCQGQWWPPMDFAEAFTRWHEVGFNYDGRMLELPGATAIHFAHRIGALMVLLYVGWLAVRVLRLGHEEKLCRYGMLLLVVLLSQTALGIMSVVAHMALAIAVAHSALAALMVMTLVTLYHLSRAPRTL
jgi:cytochrome c oxidase assembly protein subunit 15